MERAPARKHIVLVGSGHAHATVIRALGMSREPGVIVTVIAKELDAPYSGMLPGYVSGHYSYDDVHIDVIRVASWAGVRVVHGVATGVDRSARRVLIEGRPPLAYDLLSINVGITPALDDIAGAKRHTIAVKPVSLFARKWADLEARALQPGGPRRLAVVGAGAAGFELVLAARHRLRSKAEEQGINADDFSFALITGARLLPTHNARAQALARQELERQGVTLLEGARVTAVTESGLVLEGGKTWPADAVLMSTHAGAAPWFKETGLPVDGRGFLALRPTLQLIDDDDVFAAGDCATVLQYPREKAGVFAVRQGPVLTENLLRRVRGEAAQPFHPQRDFLTLLSTGGKSAIAARNGLAVAGPWLWRWKDHIDRKFMRMFKELPAMSDGAADAGGDSAMRCAGCAAKVGPVSLAAALAQSGVSDPAAAADDAAIIAQAGSDTVRVESIDFFRAIWPEPYVFGQIAAQHALNDIYAMGATPTHALANAVLPYAAPHLVQSDLTQLLAGANNAFAADSAAIVGGHSSEGAELAAGFFVSGEVARAKLTRKGGLKLGDRLILTRPVGTGVLFAGMMRGKARGADIAAALNEMRRSNRAAAGALVAAGASAMTDVTGFGLAGHLIEMLRASGVSAGLNVADVPLYRGAVALARSGVASTLLPENLCLAGALRGEGPADAATLALLFDPQTSGGLLAGVPAAAAQSCVETLQAQGFESAAIIGSVIAAPPGADAPVLVLNGAIKLE